MDLEIKSLTKKRDLAIAEVRRNHEKAVAHLRAHHAFTPFLKDDFEHFDPKEFDAAFPKMEALAIEDRTNAVIRVYVCKRGDVMEHFLKRLKAEKTELDWLGSIDGNWLPGLELIVKYGFQIKLGMSYRTLFSYEGKSKLAIYHRYGLITWRELNHRDWVYNWCNPSMNDSQSTRIFLNKAVRYSNGEFDFNAKKETSHVLKKRRKNKTIIQFVECWFTEAPLYAQRAQETLRLLKIWKARQKTVKRLCMLKSSTKLNDNVLREVGSYIVPIKF